MLKGDTDTDTDTLISEISIPIPILILFKYRISILIRYRYDTFGQKYRNFDTDTIVSKVSASWNKFEGVPGTHLKQRTESLNGYCSKTYTL